MNDKLLRLAVLGPPLVLAGFQLGRGVGNVALTIYVLYALAGTGIFRRRPPVPAWLFLGGLAALAISLVLYGIDLGGGGREMLKLTLVMMATIYATAAVAERPQSVHDMSLALFLLALSAPANYLGRLIYYYLTGQYEIITLINGLHVAALAPLGLVFLGNKRGYQALWIVLVTAMLCIGTSRTEILMIVAGFLSVYAFQSRHLAWLALAVPVAVIAAVGYGIWVRPNTLLEHADLYTFLNNLSSERLQLWELAVDHPPQNPWLGVGGAQSPHYFHLYHYPHDSFHNAFMDIWYEGGWIGFAFITAGYGILLSRLGDNYRRLAGEERWIYACLFGSAVASFCASMLDRGHTSVLFSSFLLYCCLMLYFYRPRQPAEA